MPDPRDPLVVVPPPLRGFWARFGRGLGSAARATGTAVATAWRAVDPDARRQLAELPLMGLTMIGPARGEVAPLPDDGHPPVIFVHGLGGHRGNFLPMRAWFRLHGRSRAWSAHLPPGASLERMAEHLRAFIGRVVEVNDLPESARVELVAHSMGGLVARLAVADAATARRVSLILTVATPHAGTLAARWAYTPQALELRPDAPVFRLLEAQLPWREPPRLVSLWSRADTMLLPATTAVVEGARNIEVPGMGHTAWLLSLAGWRTVFDALQVASADGSRSPADRPM